ncbi:MAG: ATP-binding protein [Dissulfuribacterales bacterium]
MQVLESDSGLLSSIFDLLNSTVLIVFEDNVIAMSNKRAEQLFRAQAGGLSGLDFSEIFMPDDRDILLPNILHLTYSAGEYEGEAMLRRRDGSTFMALLATSACRFNGHRAAIIIINDISRLKGIERILNQSERMAFWGAMLDDISHQIRNPVLAIGGFARRLANMDVLRKDYLKVILHESSRLELLLNTLTEYIEMPRPVAEPTPISRVIEAIMPEVQRLVDGYGMVLHFECVDGICAHDCVIDIQAFQKALMECVKNACDASAETESKLLELFVKQSDREPYNVLFELRDYGQGVRSQMLPKIFDPFFSTKSGHIGMGLTFARRIIDEQAGHMVIESEPNVGTTVKFYFVRERRRSIRTKRMFDV